MAFRGNSLPLNSLSYMSVPQCRKLSLRPMLSQQSHACCNNENLYASYNDNKNLYEHI